MADKNLINYLPPIYENNATMQKTQGILSDMINAAANAQNETLNECFVATASKLLGYWEYIYGLSINTSKTDTFRRERIQAKMRGVGTTTKQMIIDTARAYSGGEVEVPESPGTCSFVIKFVGTVGIPANMADLIVTIEEIKPAHLVYTFEYSYNTWSQVSSGLWGAASSKTWYEFATE
jgi:uncharacterized protein YmfQ (DUF2313 family)